MAVQPQNMSIESWNFGYKNKRYFTIYVIKAKGLISCAVTGLRLCFCIYKNGFSHEAARMSSTLIGKMVGCLIDS